MKKVVSLVVIGLLAFAQILTGCGQSPAAGTTPQKGPAWAQSLAPLPQETVVKVGMKQVVSDAGILIGMAKGYYQDLGIKIEPVQFNSGQEMINQLASGQLDVAAAVTTSGLMNAMSRDIPVKIVADKGVNVSGKGYYRLIIRKDLKNEIKDFADLRGRKIAVVGTASLDEVYLARCLNKGGLTLSDIDEQVIRAFPDMLVALSNKSIDAAMVIEPFVTAGITKDIADPWKDPDDYDPEAQIAILIYGTNITKRPEVANRFMTAYIKSVRDYNDAFFKNIDKAAIIDILTKYSVVKDAALYEKMYPVGLNPDGFVRMNGIKADLDWYIAYNLLKTPDIKAEDTVDNQYAAFAGKILGKYNK